MSNFKVRASDLAGNNCFMAEQVYTEGPEAEFAPWRFTIDGSGLMVGRSKNLITSFADLMGRKSIATIVSGPWPAAENWSSEQYWILDGLGHCWIDGVYQPPSVWLPLLFLMNI